MCGICGIVGKEEKRVARGRVLAMMRAMTHRGPDGEGILDAPGATLGMRRLNIIDIPGGQQPVWNEAQTMAVVFNGEIYNFKELRRTLAAKGHRFATQSDTETIIHAYEQWGAECVGRLRGMFAFAIAELPDGACGPVRRVFLARDRIGIKPLYYAVAGGEFIFASEVRALLSSGCIRRQLSASAVHSYLLFGSVCQPLTIVESIFSVPPGSSGYVSPDFPATFNPQPYWRLSDATNYILTDSASPAERVRAALEDSVCSHLVSDVPVGIFLSGGVDSTALVAIASRQCGRVKTFTLAFSEDAFNEAHTARNSAQQFDTDHAELLLAGEEVRGRVGEAIIGLDQPSADGINTFFISWAARQAGLKVALSGLGSDELFGGYHTFHETRRISQMVVAARYVPVRFRELAARFADSLKLNTPPDRSRKAIAAFLQPKDLPHPYFFTRILFVPQITRQAIRNSHIAKEDALWWKWLSNAAAEATHLDGLTAVSWLELRSYLLNTLLRDADSMSMANSLEVRVPFLDDSLLRTVLSCPASAKFNKDARKALLLGAVGDLLPENVVRQSKRTFTLPWEIWLRGPLREQVQWGLSNCDPALAEIIDIQWLIRIWQDFMTGRTSWSRPWSLFVLNEWVKLNFGVLPSVSTSESAARTPALS